MAADTHLQLDGTKSGSTSDAQVMFGWTPPATVLEVP